MFQSMKLGKFFGIDLYIHGTFWLLPLFVFISGMLSGVTPVALGGELAFLFAVFGCVVLHEVGHALAARGYGIATRDITLYPLGGVASPNGCREPGREIAIALAGPAVNVVIAIGLFAILVGESLLTPFALAATGRASSRRSSEVALGERDPRGVQHAAGVPMDGGRAAGGPRHSNDPA